MSRIDGDDHQTSAARVRKSDTLWRTLVCLKMACKIMRVDAEDATKRNERKTPDTMRRKKDPKKRARIRCRRVTRTLLITMGRGDVA